MEENQFLIIRKSACEQWLFYEKYRLAYSAAYEKTRRSATILNWLTIGLGALTTALAALSTQQVPTVIVGFMTTIAAGLQQTFNWEEKARLFWRARATMEQVCRDLRRYVNDVALSRGASYDPLYEQRLAPPELEVSGLDRFVDRARANLRDDSISTLILLAPLVEAAEEEATSAEEGVEGMVAVQRGNA